ncbi:tyrosine-type recombinase/integrase [Staphylococcus epidermidis]|uniref:tyrosine-type recombinase/integrase n=1 Tax=Staphylococcus epidermidis TaxID=1282 RepID=UPI001605261A|nr:site-specific integrase [Staphylococcus epidermidis]
MNVYKRGNTFQYDFYFKGKRYRKSGYLTKRDAQIAMNIKLNDLLEGYDTDNNLTFVDFYYRWLEITKLDIINDTSYKRYITAIKAFKDCFGNKLISDIDSLSYQKFLKDYGRGHFLNNGQLRPRTSNTVSKMNNCLKQAFESAVEQGYIKKNPAKNAKPFGLKSSQSIDDKFMSITQMKNLIHYVKKNDALSHLCIYILIITGSRFKPVQHLRYEDLNFKKSCIHLNDTKNKYSKRNVKVRIKDLEYIQSVINKHPINQNGYIFHNFINFISYSAINDVLVRFCLKYKYDKYTLKSLRHTHCSYLLAKGISIQYISKRLGHADIHTTLKIYSHLIKEFEDSENSPIEKNLNDLFSD